MRDLAGLAALFVVGVRVPVDGRMEPQEADSENERYAQQSQCGSFCHANPMESQGAILTLMIFKWQGNYGHHPPIANGTACRISFPYTCMRPDCRMGLRNVPSTLIFLLMATYRVHEEPRETEI